MSEKNPVYLSEEYRNSLGALIKLSEAQTKRLKKKLKSEIKKWRENNAPLHRKLQRWNDLLEGVVEDAVSFEGASNIHVPVVAIYCKVYHSIERRSILGAERIWYAETDDDTIRDASTQIEDSMNYKAKNEWNISSCLSDVFFTTNRDGLGIMQISYMEEYEENKQDIVIITSPEDYREEFPTPEDAGVSPEEYMNMLQYVSANATPENPIEIPITYDLEVYRGPYGEVVELADFVICPSTAQSISRQHAHGYGKRFYATKSQIARKAEQEVWYKEACEKFLNKNKLSSQVSSYKHSKDTIDGIAGQDRSDEPEFFELVYWCRLDPKGPEEKLLLVYSEEEDEIMSAIYYPYRVDYYAFFRIHKKTNRLIGGSVVGENEDMNEEVDALHNQRINSRKIAEVPSFKGKKDAASDFDPNAEQNLWRPGVIFWLTDPGSFEQFKVQPVDLNSSMAEEANDLKITSLMTGVEPFLFSGNPTEQNPDAPGNKTALLIQQSNLRMDDTISELIDGVEQVGNICLSMEYQFGDPIVRYVLDQGTGAPVTKTFSKRILRRGWKMKMSGVTVAMNPEAEFQKWINYATVLTQFPMIGANAQSVWELLKNALRNGRIPNMGKILPPLEQVLLQQQQMMAAQAGVSAEQDALAQEKIENEKRKSSIDRAKTQVQAEKLQADRVKTALSVKKAEQNAKAKSKPKDS